jgi:hypothetical protein
MADLEVRELATIEDPIIMLISKSAISLSDSGSGRDTLEVRPSTILESQLSH